ncbi:MAG: hypothetical protein KKC80_08705 [Candidatus Margulisbacteria bacterium]|nr:hypothetical protein [Candidatus Margulisiibacteriota bacterium]
MSRVKKLKEKQAENTIRLQGFQKLIFESEEQYQKAFDQAEKLEQQIAFLKKENQIIQDQQILIEKKICEETKTYTQDNSDDHGEIDCKLCNSINFIAKQKIISGIDETYITCTNCHSKIILFARYNLT